MKKVFKMTALFAVLSLMAAGCQKDDESGSPAGIPGDPVEHHALYGTAWENEDTLTYGGVTSHMLKRLFFTTDSTGDYYYGFELVNYSPWWDTLLTITYTFNSETFELTASLDSWDEPEVLVYHPDEQTLVIDNPNPEYVTVFHRIN